MVWFLGRNSMMALYLDPLGWGVVVDTGTPQLPLKTRQMPSDTDHGPQFGSLSLLFFVWRGLKFGAPVLIWHIMVTQGIQAPRSSKAP